MKKVFSAEMYDCLMYEIESCICKIEWEALSSLERILIIGSNETDKFEKLMHNLLKVNPNVMICVVAHKHMLIEMSDFFNENCIQIEWKGNYSEAIVDAVAAKIDVTGFDSILYFGLSPLCIRDMNIWKIAHELLKRSEIEVFMMDASKEIYQISNLSYYLAANEMYHSIENYLEQSCLCGNIQTE